MPTSSPYSTDPQLGDDVLIAGDWNIGTWWASEGDAKYARREEAVLQLLKAYGFVDCLDRHLPPDRGRLLDCPCQYGEACRHHKTYRRRGSNSAFQDDYMFATSSLADRMRRAEVHPGWDWTSTLSDHAPLVADVAPPRST